MKSVFKKILDFLYWLSVTKWWTHWSNIRFRKYIRDDVDVNESDLVKTVQDIRSVSRKVYSRFRYERDGANQLWDAITPPPHNYTLYREGVVEDDCDGFHSTLYHILHKSNIECYLLAVAGIGGGHCVLVFQLNNLWHVVDYTTVYRGYATICEAVYEYNKKYKEVYDYNKSYIYNAAVKYDYKKKKLLGVTIGKINENDI